jgi:hypothetical protein
MADETYKGKILPLRRNEDGSTDALYLDSEGGVAEVAMHDPETRDGKPLMGPTYMGHVTFREGSPLGDAEITPLNVEGPPKTTKAGWTQAYADNYDAVFGPKELPEA